MENVAMSHGRIRRKRSRSLIKKLKKKKIKIKIKARHVAKGTYGEMYGCLHYKVWTAYYVVFIINNRWSRFSVSVSVSLSWLCTYVHSNFIVLFFFFFIYFLMPMSSRSSCSDFFFPFFNIIPFRFIIQLLIVFFVSLLLFVIYWHWNW